MEYRVNEGLLIFSATTLILVLGYIFTKKLELSYLFILYAIGVWRFDRTVVIFKKGDADEVKKHKISKDSNIVEKRRKNS